MSERNWVFLGSQDVSDHRIFQIRHDLYRLEPAGLEQDFVVIETPDWVNVVPLTDDGHVVLVRQFRHGIRRDTLEVPGGMVDPGESPEEAAVRELAEETGYVADRVRFLGRVHPNPAIQGNWSYTYLAEGCRPNAEPSPDLFERIEVEVRPLSDVPDLIRREEISHSLMVNAFAFLGIVARP